MRDASPRFPALPLALACLVGLAATANAETVIRLSTEPLLDETRSAPSAPIDREAGFFALDETRKGAADSTIWLFPYLVDDTSADASSALFSIRHAGDDLGTIRGSITLLDQRFSTMAQENFEIAANELTTRNLANDPDAVDPGDIRRGFVRVVTDGTVEVDFFQVDDAGDFATGDQALVNDDFCSRWNARFLRFGPADAEGTQLTFLVNGPRGGNVNIDPPTVTGEIYDEAGVFFSSFEIFTNDWFFDIPARELAMGAAGDDSPPPDFGTIRIELDTLLAPAGVVLERHTAFGQFSVGTQSFCRD